tara:strand:- start:184 stop:435 length:252 start_codon:yes stop_codon:yes gene_type:complete
MSKTTIEFNSDNHDDKMSLYRCLKSTDMAGALFQIHINLYKKCINILDAEGAEDPKYEGVELVFRHINRIFEEYNIDVDDLID